MSKKYLGGFLLGGTSTTTPASGDPQFNYVTALLHGDGTNGAQNNTFLDSSTNAFTITRNGNTTQGSFSPYGSLWSNYINGSVSGAYLQAASSSATAFGTGNFTIEMWVNSGAQSNTRLAGNGNGGSWTSGKWVFATSTSPNPNKFVFACNNYASAADMLVSTTASNDGIWHHIAVVRNSNTWTLYVDGTSQSTVTTSVSLDNGTANPIGIGYSMISGDTGYTGYISNFRMCNTAVYTSNFTPSTTPLTAISGTQLLTCQSNRLIDNSTNALAITPASSTTNPFVQRFSPFNISTAYSTSVIGGSGYFDGSGDYLGAGSGNSAFAFGSGDFTIEGWFYATTSNSGWGPILSVGTNSGGQLIRINQSVNNTGFYGFLYPNSSNSADVYVNTGTAFPLNQWVHLALVRSSTTLTLYTNGVQVLQATGISFNFTNTNGAYIGYGMYSSDGYYTGYSSNVRIVKGTAVYTAAFTPPTAPLTAITNTSLLCNFTNAAIYDNAEMSVYETVGNAQISTSVYKYGTGSLYFNGSSSYLQAPNTVNANFGSGDFTIEFWMYASSQALAPIVHQTSYASSLGWIVWNYDGANVGTSTRKLTFMANGAGFVLTTSSDAYTDNTWTHIAVVKNGTGTNNIKIYSNGTSIATGTYATALSNSTQPLVVGGIISGVSWNTTAYYNGYIDDLRITKGYARYTANFTPPTAALPDSYTPSVTTSIVPTASAAPGIWTMDQQAYYKAQGLWPSPPTFSYLVVAGGGGGGTDAGGGGGAGGLLTNSSIIVSAGVTYTVTVGGGGTSGAAGNAPTNGSNSVLSGSGFTTQTAIGGGYGSYYNGNAANSGGSGGGGGIGSVTAGGAGTSGQGYAGGTTVGYMAGGGGAGGIGGPGTSSVGGYGGPGAASSITGSSVYYAGGGAGGGDGRSGYGVGGTGGTGGGGNGNSYGVSPTAGSTNTGGGGGGGYVNVPGAVGGAGGSGVVIISASQAAASTTGSPTVTTNGSLTVYKFTSSGSITF